MKKIKWKSKRFIGGLLTLVALGFGLPPVFAPVATDVICEQAECEE